MRSPYVSHRLELLSRRPVRDYRTITIAGQHELSSSRRQGLLAFVRSVVGLNSSRRARYSRFSVADDRAASTPRTRHDRAGVEHMVEHHGTDPSRQPGVAWRCVRPTACVGVCRCVCSCSASRGHSARRTSKWDRTVAGECPWEERGRAVGHSWSRGRACTRGSRPERDRAARGYTVSSYRPYVGTASPEVYNVRGVPASQGSSALEIFYKWSFTPSNVTTVANRLVYAQRNSCRQHRLGGTSLRLYLGPVYER